MSEDEEGSGDYAELMHAWDRAGSTIAWAGVVAVFILAFLFL